MTILKIEPQLLISMPGGSEWLIIALVFIVLFGGRKIPELAKGLGKGMREFKNAKEGVEEEIKQGAAAQQQPGVAEPRLK